MLNSCVNGTLIFLIKKINQVYQVNLRPVLILHGGQLPMLSPLQMSIFKFLIYPSEYKIKRTIPQ